ncbi:MAG TPA: septum formation initiator family protein [Acidobacteriaceae bacterium]|nr:septum formation initiator family protein [Acidobacteriaceae bacterium]
MSGAENNTGEVESRGAIVAGAGFLYRMRRRIATGMVVVGSLFFGYHAFFGENGVNMYAQKRVEGRDLTRRIADLQADNARLQLQVKELKSDPDAIEHEARERLHYARPGEVIWSEDDQATATPAAKK